MDVREQQQRTFAEALDKATRAILKPPPDLTLSEWSLEYMYLSPEASALPGRFTFDRAPFQRAVFDTLSDPNNRRVVIMAASQVLKTQAILNYVGYITHLDPGPILVVQPTKKMIDSFSKDRVDTLYRDVRELRELIPDKRKRDSGNTVAHKRFPGGYLAMASSNSPADLASRPIRFLFCDETDRYDVTSEGDPIDIAEKRTTTFWNSKVVLTSSPGDDDISRIKQEYERSDKRIFMVPCHECGEEQQLLWGKPEDSFGVKFDPEDTSTAYYQCAHCDAKWSDTQKNINVSKGRWQATAKSNIAGFHISAMYSSFKTLQDLADEFLAAKNDPEQLKVFVNTRLAETWESDTSRVNDINFADRLEDYTPDTIPEDVLLLTAGVDVQVDRLEMEVVGWGLDDESWGIEYAVMMGNPTSPTPWNQLREFLKKTYTRADGLKLRIDVTCIDSGGEVAPDNLFSFIRETHGHTIYAIKGRAGNNPIFQQKASKHKAGGRLHIVGVDTAKQLFYSQLSRVTEPGPGYCHFPAAYGEIPDYFECLTSEKSVIKYTKGGRKKVWIKDPNTRNEALDCRVYALAGRKSIQRTNMYALKDRRLKQVGKQTGKEETPTPKTETNDEQMTHEQQMRRQRQQQIRRPRRGGYISGIS